MGLWPFTPIIQACILPCKQLSKIETHCFQEKTSESVHENSFSSIISKLSFDFHHIWPRSCIGPRLNLWFYTCPIILYFIMAFNIFSLALCIRSGFPHLMAGGFSQCICGQPIDSTWIHLLRCVHEGEHIATHDAVRDFCAPLLRMLGFMFHTSKFMFFWRHLSGHHGDKWTLCLQQMVFTLW
jgi:hypothetical protein